MISAGQARLYVDKFNADRAAEERAADEAISLAADNIWEIECNRLDEKIREASSLGLSEYLMKSHDQKYDGDKLSQEFIRAMHQLVDTFGKLGFHAEWCEDYDGQANIFISWEVE